MNNPTSNACANCQTTQGFLNRIWIADSDKPVLLCEDCAEEAHRIDALADQLAALPSCEVRQQLIDHPASTAQLVNALCAHDLAQCAQCTVRKRARLALLSEAGCTPAEAVAYIREVA